MPYKPQTHAQRMKAGRPVPRDDRPSASKRGYGARWRRRRKMYLAKNPLCVECKKAGYTVAAALVDHIIPLSQGGKDEEINYQSLCVMHHNQKIAKERTKKELTGMGAAV